MYIICIESTINFTNQYFIDLAPKKISQKNTTINYNEKYHFNNASNFTYIEKIVALNKHLMNDIFHQIQGKWYFTKLQLQNVPLEKSYPNLNKSSDE